MCPRVCRMKELVLMEVQQIRCLPTQQRERHKYNNCIVGLVFQGSCIGRRHRLRRHLLRGPSEDTSGILRRRFQTYRGRSEGCNCILQQRQQALGRMAIAKPGCWNLGLDHCKFHCTQAKAVGSHTSRPVERVSDARHFLEISNDANTLFQQFVRAQSIRFCRPEHELSRYSSV